MGGKQDVFGLLPADTGIGDGNERIEVLFAGFAINKRLAAFLDVAFQHQTANGFVGTDGKAVGVTHSLNQDVIEDLPLAAVILIFISASITLMVSCCIIGFPQTTLVRA